LRLLSFQHNKLTSLPEEITRLSYLESLELHENQLEILPDNLNGLKTLQNLTIHSNKLINLPNSIIDLQYLKVLLLYNNPLKLTDDQKLWLDSIQKRGCNVQTQFAATPAPV